METNFNKYNEKSSEFKPLADDITKIETDDGYEKVEKVEIIQVIGILSDEEAAKVDEALIVHAGNFSNEEIKRGEYVWLSCLMKKPGVSYTAQTQGVIKCRIVEIYLGLSKLNQLF